MTRAVLAVAAVGFMLVAGVAVVSGLPAGDAFELVGVAGAGAVVAGACGTLVLRMLRDAALSVQVTVVVLTAVGAVAIGALAAGNAMFLSAQDYRALSVIVVTAGVVGVLVALALGRRVGIASRLLEAAARRIGEGGAPDQGRPSIREFADLAAQLDETAARLEEARTRERALEDARRELVSWVSHDLRTPLAGIRALTEALEDEVVTDPATVRRYYRSLRAESDRLAGLVDDLFELSRIHAGALRLDLEPTDLGELVSEALAAADPRAAAKGVRLSGRVNGRVPVFQAAPAELARVLRNLVDNAVRETPTGGEVRVEAVADRGAALVTVADGCGGIPDADRARLFDTGFRRQAARTPTGDAGAGLGLAIAKGLVEAHGGDISVENRGAGCRFAVRLPVS